MTGYPNFQSNSFVELRQAVEDIISVDEMCLIQTTLGSGLERRLTDWCKYFAQHGTVIEVDAQSSCLEKIQAALSSTSQKKYFLCVIHRIDHLLINEFRQLMAVLYQLRLQHGIKIIMTMYGNYYGKKYQTIWGEDLSFYPTVVNFPLLSQEDGINFATYLSNKWKINHLSQKSIEEIISLAGGWMAMIKHLTWDYKMSHTNNKQVELLNPQSMWLTANLWQQFDQDEQRIIMDAVHNRPHNPHSHSQTIAKQYLINMRILSTDGQNLLIGALDRYINHYVLDAADIIRDKEDDKILLGNSTDLSQQLTPIQNKLLSCLIEQTGRVVNKDDLIETAWGTNNSVSDWSLNSQIYRLRQKLQALGLDKQRLRTIKKSGFMWRG